MPDWADKLRGVLWRRPTPDGGASVSGATPAVPPSVRPPALGLASMFEVRVETDLYGNYDCVGRRLSAVGLTVETADLIPLGTAVRVRFLSGDQRMVRPGVVNTHYYLNYADRRGRAAMAGMSIKFTGPAELCDDPDADPGIQPEAIQ